jgi:hypothetical protein
MPSSSVNNTQHFGNSAELSEANGNSAGNSWVVLATNRGFLLFGSDTGSPSMHVGLSATLLEKSCAVKSFHAIADF